jgi:hypothetical protein
MNRIVSLLLRAKHWQLFLGLFAVPALLDLAALGASSSGSRGGVPTGPTLVLVLAMLLYILFFLVWFASMVFFFQSITSADLRMPTSFFKFALVYPVVYLPVFSYLTLFRSLDSFTFIFPLRLACTICCFYDLYFVSKSLATAQIGKPLRSTITRAHFYFFGFIH